MAKIIQFTSSFLLPFILLFTISCGQENAIKKETRFVLNENKEWLSDDAVGSSFIMMDNNQISQSFKMDQSGSGFSPSTSSYFWIKTKTIEVESYSQGFTPNYGLGFSFLLTAGSIPFGDNLTVSFGYFSFTYDFKYQTISRLSSQNSYLSKDMIDDRYEENQKIYSTVNLIDTLRINSHLYTDILHFRLEDFANEWAPTYLRDIYLAKHVGLIKYKLNNGVFYERQ